MTRRANPKVMPAESASPLFAIPSDIDVFELAALGMVVTDMTGCFRRVNPAFADLVGRDRSDLLGSPFSSLTSPDDMGPSTAAMRDLLTKVVELTSFEKRYVRPDGTMVRVEMHIRALHTDVGKVCGFLAQAVDITDRTRAENATEVALQRLEVAQRDAGMGSFDQDPTTGVIRPSRELCRIFGLSDLEDIDFATLLDQVHPDDRPTLSNAMGACMEAGTPVDVVHRLVPTGETVRWIHALAKSKVGEDGRRKVAGTAMDITERRQTQDDLNFLTFRDTLTGLANRAMFLDRVDHALNQGGRRADPIAVLFMDLDDFKAVNDSLGHQIGDELLVAVAKRLTSATRAGDTLARLGGDDFALLLESGPMPDTAKATAMRIAEALNAPFDLGDIAVPMSISIGIAVDGPVHGTSEELLRDADLAMYLAKQNGKGHFELVRPGMQDEALKHLAIVTDLRHAIDSGELEVFYQPIVRAHDATAAGAEALVRWHHPRQGLLSPSEFIDVAESTGMIVPLGDWVLNEACQRAQDWRLDGTVEDAFYVSVNLSPRQLGESTLVESVARALRSSGLPARNLVLEITESTLMLDFDAGLTRLRSLKDLGLRLALDDYGTGYSSLNRLGKLPVDIVKIDKSFIDQLNLNRKGRALVQSIIGVSRDLGISSIAEGVEQPGQRDSLQQLGCDHIQGFLFAKPMPPGEAARTLQYLRGDRVPARVATDQAG